MIKEEDMNKNTKLTLEGLIQRKEQILDGKRSKATKELYIPSLDSSIVIEEPTASLVRDANDMDTGDGDVYLCYKCIKEPNVSAEELAAEFGCAQPMDIIEKIFLPGEIPQISLECMKLAGYANGVKEIKN